MESNLERDTLERGIERPFSGTRDSNLELYRIILMLLIVAHHYVVNSGLLEFNSPIFQDALSSQSMFLLIFGAWGKTGINCFLLVTGYYMCNSKITVTKFLKLLLEVFFYKIIIYCVFLLMGYEHVSIDRLLKVFLPVTEIGYNFTSCYLVFYLIIPFLNILIHNMNKHQHMFLVGFSFIICIMSP